MPTPHPLVYNTAVADFRRARKKAAFQQVMARLRGRPADLLAYEDVCRHLKADEAVKMGVQEIPLDAIVGSVGRYKDFTRDFLPKHDSDAERWARVKTAVMDMVGMPPIDVYKVGDVYFVIDGNHRVSVARELGGKTISARVTEVKTRVPLSPDDDPDEIICKARYAEFLEQTNLDVLRPEADLYMTFCGHFRHLLAQIEAYKQQVEAETTQEMTHEAAVARWYDEVYIPVVEMIEAQGMMRQFPERTAADLYVLLSERREEIEHSLGWEVDLDEAAAALAATEARRPRGFGGRLLQAIVPPELADGPEPGQWRKFQTGRNLDRLFADYLVAMGNRKSDWQMLDQVIQLATLDNDRLLGLHVVSSPEDVEGETAQAVQVRFRQQCAAAGVAGELAVEAGNVVETIVKRSVWADLVVLGLEHPPGGRPLQRIGNRTSQIIQRCPRPVLVIPAGAKRPLGRVLLAYDGSPKADEALFVATYLRLRHPISLTVVTVVTEYTPPEALDKARAYLAARGVTDAAFVLRQKPIAAAVLDTAVTHDINFLIMGGFGFQPMMHLMLGSTVDEVLRRFPHPILICR